MIAGRRSVATILAAWALLAPAADGTAAAECPPSDGPLVIVGGGLSPDNEAIYRAILERRVGDGPICVLPTASGIPQRSMREYAADFRRWGGDDAALEIPLTFRKPARARKEAFTRRLESCGGFFFTGGDQSRIVDTLRPEGRSTPAEQALLAVHRRGGVIAGSSAGAAMMSDPMIGAGESADALQFGIVDTDGPPGVWIRDGMGYFRDGLIDQHNLARGRLGRMLVAVAALEGVERGFAIDEDTALVVDGFQVRVVGSSQVAVVELGQRGAGASAMDGASFRLWLLGDGDGYDLRDGWVFYDDEKRQLPADGASPEPPADPWLDDALHRSLIELARSPAAELTLQSAGYRLRFAKQTEFDCRAYAALGERMESGLSVGPYWLDVSAEGRATPAGNERAR